MARPPFPAGSFIRSILESSKHSTSIKLRCLERLHEFIETETVKRLDVPGYCKGVTAVCKNSRHKSLVRGALRFLNVLIDKVDITFVPIDIQRDLVSSILSQTVIRGREFDAVCDHLRQVMGEVVDEESDKLRANVPVKKLTRLILDILGVIYDDTDVAQIHRILCSALSGETYNATDLLEQYGKELSDQAKDSLLKVFRKAAEKASPTTSDVPSDDAVDESPPEFENPVIVEQDISSPGSTGEQNIASPGSIGEQDTTLPRPIVELNIPSPDYFGEQNILSPGSTGEQNIASSSSIGEQDTTLPRPVVELNIPSPGYFGEQNILLPGSTGEQNIASSSSIGEQDTTLPRPIVELNIPSPGSIGEQNILLPGSTGEQNIASPGSIGEQDISPSGSTGEQNVPSPGSTGRSSNTPRGRKRKKRSDFFSKIMRFVKEAKRSALNDPDTMRVEKVFVFEDPRMIDVVVPDSDTD